MTLGGACGMHSAWSWTARWWWGGAATVGSTGPDLFVRVLWALEHRHGVMAQGLWLGLGADPHEVARLRAEATRCGVGDRLQLRSADTEAARYCGDVVYLPYRSESDPDELLSAVASGLIVVTFPTCSVSDPGISIVDHLDVDASAGELVKGLGSDRALLAAEAEERFGVGPWVRRLLDTVRELR